MAKKYLSLEEAATMLRVSVDEVKKLREKGELRGFADRGTWKFKEEDVIERSRKAQIDSSPDVPMFDSSVVLGGQSGRPESSALLQSDDEEIAEQPTIIRGSVHEDEPIFGSTSDSDVRLILDDSLSLGGGSDPDIKMPKLGDSDSDVRLVDERAGGKGKSKSDSDVKLVKQDSVSDVRLAGEKSSSDSDVKLIGDSAIRSRGLSGSDDESVLADDGHGMGGGSDIAFAPESGISLGSLADSGISLEKGSGILLDGLDDSGIALGGADSGIGLMPHGDSGIMLSGSDDSGIRLGTPSDSGLALDSGKKKGKPPARTLAEDDDDLGGTAPMMRIPQDSDYDKTQAEFPSLGEDDDSYKLATPSGKGSGDTAVIVFDDEETDDRSQTVIKKGSPGMLGAMAGGAAAKKKPKADDDDVFEEFGDLGGDEASHAELPAGDDLDIVDDMIDDDDELDVFDAADDDFEGDFESGESHAEFVTPGGGGVATAAAEPEWGAGTFVGLLIGTGLLALCSIVMFDFVRSMWAWSEPGAVSGGIISSVSGFFK